MGNTVPIKKNILQLNDLCRIHIFAHLSPTDVGRCLTVSKSWRKLITKSNIWQMYDTIYFDHEHGILQVISMLIKYTRLSSIQSTSIACRPTQFGIRWIYSLQEIRSEFNRILSDFESTQSSFAISSEFQASDFRYPILQSVIDRIRYTLNLLHDQWFIEVAEQIIEMDNLLNTVKSTDQ